MMQKSTGLSLFQIDESRHLEQHDERDTKAELYMLRLVPKAFHPAKGPHSAAKDDKKEQDPFRERAIYYGWHSTYHRRR